MTRPRTIHPHTRVKVRIIQRRKALCLTTQQVAERVARGDLYGAYTHTALRNLEKQDFDNTEHPRNTLNKQLIIALSEALNCSVSDLATEHELESMREMPYRRAQWPQFALDRDADSNPDSSVPSPDITAQRIYAYLQQHGYRSTEEIGKVLRRFRIDISNSTVWRLFNGKAEHQTARARVITYRMLQKVTYLFQAKGSPDFRTLWLVECQPGRCPHCDPRLKDY